MKLGEEMVKQLIEWAKHFPFYGQEQFSRKLFLQEFEKFVKELNERLETLEKK